MEPNNDKTSKGNLIGEQKLTLKELFIAIVRQWRWILLSLMVCIGLAVLYLAWKPFSYTREAQVEIKEDGESGSSSALAMFADLGIGNSTNNLYNEMAYFESPDLMGQVVERLGLQTTYVMKEGLRGYILYGSSLPITVTFETLQPTIGGKFKIKIDDNGDIFLSNFKVKKDKVPFDKKKAWKFGQSIMTPLGKIKIEKTPFFGKDKDEDDDKGYDIIIARSSMKGAIKDWLSKTSVNELRKEASIVDLTVTDGSARRAEDVLNTMIDIYNENWIRSKNEVALASSDFIDDRLASISSELSEVDSDISDYKSENQIPDLIASATISLNEEQNARSTLLTLNSNLQLARYLKDYIEKNDNPGKTLPSNLGMQNQVLDTQIAAHNNMVQNRNASLNASSAENPLVMSLESQIEDSRNAILASIENQIKIISQEIATVNKERLSFEKNLASNPEQARYLLSVERQQKVKESLYLYLLQKKEENQLNQAFTPYNTRVIARPNGDSEPTSPKPVSILMMAFILGLAIPVGTIYVREVTNTKVRDKNDLKGLSIPFLGEIPKVNHKKYDDKDHMVVVGQGNRNVVNEAYRVVRTNLNFMIDGEEKCPVVMLTSFNPGSGKSFIAINLAMSLAIRGKKVLVIDGDMRRNSSSVYVGNPDAGLAQCLIGKITPQQAIVRGRLNENLDVLPGGKTPPNPTELLENGRLATLIEQLRQDYDVIFIDCPPIQMIADGRIFSTVCTNTIFVLRAGLFERGLLSELENVYRSKEYHNMCLLLNDTEGSGGYGGYGHYGAGKSYYAQKD
ncbi:MAG: polysaccharide biosynthesis tyrosine autokinase [Muribaculaceae bacterium]|nr:polysaccharide biosynthesis tyrosine autokinase [Muribaculaceae bacterium]